MPVHNQPTWRTPVLYRLFFPAVGLSFLFATIVYFDGGADLPYTALSLILGLALTIGPFRPVVRLEQRDVYARGLVFSRRMPLRDIVQIEGGYGGLNFTLRDGRGFEASGVGEKMNVTSWLGREGKADSIADTINGARERVIAALPVDQQQTLKQWSPPEPPPLPAYVKIVQGVGTAVFLLGAYLAFISDKYVGAGLPMMVVGTAAPVLVMLWAQKRNGAAGDSD